MANVTVQLRPSLPGAFQKRQWVASVALQGGQLLTANAPSNYPDAEHLAEQMFTDCQARGLYPLGLGVLKETQSPQQGRPLIPVPQQN